MNKTEYIAPEMELISFECVDVITQSLDKYEEVETPFRPKRNSGTLKFGNGWWSTGEGDNIDD